MVREPACTCVCVGPASLVSFPCCVGRLRLACFTLSVFLLVFFLFPPHPHRTLPSTQTLISQISEKVGPFHFLPIYSSPVEGCSCQWGPAGSFCSLRLAPVRPAPSAPSKLCSELGAVRAGLPALHVPLLGSLRHHIPACPLSWLPCWVGGRVGRHVHGMEPYPPAL